MNLPMTQRGICLSTTLFILLLSSGLSASYAPEPRWGQATVLINDALFVYGGKTDQFNSYSYTSAPNTNDLLYLPLSRPFDAANPPWELVSNSTNTSISQGPTIVWHTLSAFNDSGVLLFGGQPGPNSPTVIVDRADSAFLLDLPSPLQPIWHSEAASWAGEPVRRMYHSSATSPSGIIYITGGQAADGSGRAFSDHYAFDPQALTFSGIPSNNGPPALYGHASVMLPDGRLFVFGGVSDGSLNPLSTIWVLDTANSNLAWVLLQVDASLIPASRRAFAAVAIGQGKILIQGGSDANLQSNIDDGWILDTSKDPATWTQVKELTQVGARRDHCAILSNGLVIFGFGYTNSGPAQAAIHIFDPSSNTYLPSYSPPPPSTSVTRTMPGPTSTASGTGTHPGSATTTMPGGTTNTAGPGWDGDDKKKPIAAIIVGTTLGVLGAIAVGAVVIIYSRRQQRKRRGSFMVIEDNEDGGDNSLRPGSTIPVAVRYDEKGTPGVARWGNGLLGTAFGIAGTIGAATKLRNARDTYQRRDMLADEDTRDFGEWYNARRRDGTGGSSWSLKSIIGARFRNREPSTFSHGSASHRHEGTDQLSGTSLMYDQEPGPSNDTRPRYGREASYLTTSSYSYIDPFADPTPHERERSEGQQDLGRYENSNEYEPTIAGAVISRPSLSMSTVRMIPPASLGAHPLSPLSEHTSNTSLPSNDHVTSSSHTLSSGNPIGTSVSHTTSQTTVEPNPSHFSSKSTIESTRSPKLISASIIPASVPSPGVRRSDSWWSRFYRTSFLDRRPSSTSHRSNTLDIRDPNPPPTLGPIAESTHSNSGDDASSRSVGYVAGSGRLSRSQTKVYGVDPGTSMTSLRTADTEQIERLAGAMDVVQRVRTRSQRTSGSLSSGLTIDTDPTGNDGNEQLVILSSPVEMTPLSGAHAPRKPSPAHTPLAPPPPDPLTTHLRSSSPFVSPDEEYAIETPLRSSPTLPITPKSRSSVAARVHMYERRMSQDQERPPPTNTRQLEERSPKKERVTVNYGLAPRASLFVANPDHRNSRSSDS